MDRLKLNISQTCTVIMFYIFFFPLLLLRAVYSTPSYLTSHHTDYFQFLRLLSLFLLQYLLKWHPLRIHLPAFFGLSTRLHFSLSPTWFFRILTTQFSDQKGHCHIVQLGSLFIHQTTPKSAVKFIKCATVQRVVEWLDGRGYGGLMKAIAWLFFRLQCLQELSRVSKHHTSGQCMCLGTAVLLDVLSLIKDVKTKVLCSLCGHQISYGPFQMKSRGPNSGIRTKSHACWKLMCGFNFLVSDIILTPIQCMLKNCMWSGDSPLFFTNQFQLLNTRRLSFLQQALQLYPEMLD